MSYDLITTLVLFTLVGLAALAYTLRVMIRGQAHFDRVDKQGGSALLGKQVMEAGYWILQPFARLLVFLHVTPNQLSWISFFLGLVAGVCLAFGHFGSGAVFSAISALLDTLDGMVARMTGSASDAGEVLDASVDRYAEFFFLGGLVVYYREIPFLMVMALVALMGSFMVSYSTAKAEALQITPPKGSMRRPERAFYLTLGAALSPVTIPWFEAVREYPIAIAHPMVFAIALVAVMSNLSASERLYAIAKAVRIREQEGRNAAAKARREIGGQDGQESHDDESAHHPLNV